MLPIWKSMKIEGKTPITLLRTNSPKNKPAAGDKDNRFIHAIRKIYLFPNMIKIYISHKLQANTIKHSPSPIPTSSNCEKNRLVAKKIEQENIKAIDYCKELTIDEKNNYFQFNQLGSAILKHPHYNEQEGLFRKSGNALERDRLVSHLLAGKSLKEYFLKKDIVDIKILTSAYKKLAAHLIEKNLHSLEEIPKSIHNLAYAAQQKSALLKESIARNLISQNNQKRLNEADSRLQDAFLSLEKTPLTLQLIIPLFAEITKNQQTNKMGAYNLATCFAPNLVTDSNLPPASQIKLNRDSIIYLEALINHDLKLQSYDV